MAKKKIQVNSGQNIIIMICLMQGSIGIDYKSQEYIIHSDVIDYMTLKNLCSQFMKSRGLEYEISISIPDPKHLDNHIPILPNFQISLQQIFINMNGTLILFIRGVIDEIKSNFQNKVKQLEDQIDDLRKEIQQLKKPINLDLLRKNSFSASPLLIHMQSTIQRPQNVGLDIAILFSQPLFDEQKNKFAPPAVDFRSEITRLHYAFKSSYRNTITMRCEIATFQSLKNMIRFSKPKILHIICHGNSEGSLQFEEDSRNTLGLLQLLKPTDIKNLLKNQIQILPSLVFINSCHSQSVGKSFFQLGVNNVIMINSEDPISDEAAQLFSQNFYRNIFRGSKVNQSFLTSKQNVQKRHTSNSCCCSHSNLQPHKQNCRTQKQLRKNPVQYHKDYHVPSSKCQCELRNFNRHKATCEWAQKVLLQINDDFRIPIQQSTTITTGTQKKYRFPRLISEFPQYCIVPGTQKIQLRICCCQVKGRTPHSQSNKFKYKTRDEGMSVLMPVSYNQQISEITDLTTSQLLQAHEKSKAIYGRQKQLYLFLKQIKDVNLMSVYGKSGVGITTFTVKASTYMMQRRLFQFFFFIDLYDIKDQTIFRYKFNQITKFQYDGKQINQYAIKTRKILLLFDNCDEFIDKRSDKFYAQITTLLRQIPKCKIIITFKQQRKEIYDEKKILAPQKSYELPPFQLKFAQFFLITKLKDKTDISVRSIQLKNLVTKYQILRIPKVIESLSQSIPITQKRVKIQQIQEKIQGVKLSDTNKLTQTVLKQLENKSKQAYQFLIFTSLFSDGVTFQDLDMFSTYFKKDMSILLPVKKKWQQQYLILFDKQYNSHQIKFQKTNSVSPSLKLEQVRSQTQLDIQSTKLKKLESDLGLAQNRKIVHDYLDKMDEQSYFIDKNAHNKFTVKRFIRDFLWKKHQNQTTNQIKFLFVAYFSVILEVLFQTLKQTNYVHEDIQTYSAISSSGIFAFNTSLEAANDEKRNLTKSVQFARQFMSDLDQIFGRNQMILKKMKSTDHSTFIMNHRQDFLKIYDTKWIDVFNHLKRRNKDQEKVFVILLQNLMINIPTAFKIANADTSLIKYVIRGSENQLKKMSEVSKPQRNLKLKLKLLFIQIGISLDNDAELRSLIQNGKEMIKTFKLALQSRNVQSIELRDIADVFQQQKFMMDLIMDKKSLRMQSYSDILHIMNRKFDFIVSTQKTEVKALSPLIIAKQGFIISELFLKCIQTNEINLKMYLSRANDFQKRQQPNLFNQLMEICQFSSRIFKEQNCMKLKLKAQLLSIQIFWEFNEKFKSNPKDKTFKEYIQYQRNRLNECEKDYLNEKLRLRGFTQFDSQIKLLKQQIKKILWVSASKRIIFMKAFPLCSNGYPIIKNLIRKKNNFRHQIQKILNVAKQSKQSTSDRQIGQSPSLKPKVSTISAIEHKITLDISAKYQILTKSKLIEQVIAGCSIMFLTADVRVKSNKTYLILENQILQQELLQINQQLVSKLTIDNLLILVISGENAVKAMKKIVSLSQNPPIIIALNSQADKNIDDLDYGHDFDSDHLIQSIRRENQIKLSQLTYTKQFIKRISRTKILNNSQLQKIHLQAVQKLQSQVPYRRIHVYFDMSKCHKNIHLQYNQGIYRDLSPGYQGNHNIDAKSYQNTISIKRWQKMLQFFKQISYSKRNNQKQLKNNYLQIPQSKSTNQSIQNKQATYINVYGENGSGKSFFIRQVAKNLVQRQFFDFGVYLFEGKKIQKNYAGDFQLYIQSQSKIGKLPVLQDFQKLLSQKIILIVDDFHLIKPRINARMKLFLDRVIAKKVNLILVSLNQLKLQYLPNMKKIKLQPLDSFETQILAYHLIDIKNMQQIKQFNKMKQTYKKKNIPFLLKDLANKLVNKFSQYKKKGKQSNYLPSYQQTSTQSSQFVMKKSNTSLE